MMVRFVKPWAHSPDGFTIKAWAAGEVVDLSGRALQSALDNAAEPLTEVKDAAAAPNRRARRRSSDSR